MPCCRPNVTRHTAQHRVAGSSRELGARLCRDVPLYLDLACSNGNDLTCIMEVKNRILAGMPVILTEVFVAVIEFIFPMYCPIRTRYTLPSQFITILPYIHYILLQP
jgi:hypothetical protein